MVSDEPVGRGHAAEVQIVLRNGRRLAVSGGVDHIQADAANIFGQLYNGQQAHDIEVGCLAHARRPFHRLKDTDPRAAVAIDLIAKIYRVEKAADAQRLEPDPRRELRQHKTVPILNRFKRWLARTTDREPPQSALAQACAYSLNHWDARSRSKPLKSSLAPRLVSQLGPCE